MRLKKLTLFGFKSFANKVSLNFDADVIGIVGPNGCGKSNIVDAFRWVMGELSAKNLRGDTLIDLLFAGSEKHAPCHFAEVSVHLTDVGKALPIDYDEVTITRRIHRNGESEVFINRHPARLKDIQKLLLGSGLGKGAFSIFEQGKLDAIIHKNPVERRLIFDECAGTICFLKQKKEALKNLAEVTVNCNRLRDVHAEVERHMRALKRASKVALTFQDKKNRLKALKKSLLIALLVNVIDREKTQQSSVSKQQREAETKGAQLHSLMNEQAALKQKEREAQKQLDDAKQQVYHAKSALQIKEGEHKGLGTLQEGLLRDKKHLEKECTNHERDREQMRAKRQDQKALAERALREKQQLDQEVAQAKGFFDAEESRLNGLREELKQKRQQNDEMQAKGAQLGSQLQEVRVRREGVSEQIKRLASAQLDKTEVVKELSIKAEQKKCKVEALLEGIEKLKGQESETSERVDHFKKDLNVLEQQHESLSHKIAEKRAHEKSLMALQEEFEGFSKGAKQLLANTKKRTSPLYGRLSGLYEELKPKKGLEKAFSASMRPYDQTLVVEKQEDIDVVLAFAHKEGIADFSLVCKDHLRAKNTHLPLAENGALASHFLGHVSLQKNLKSALDRVSDGALVTEEGDFIDTKHVIFKGGGVQRENNSFLRQALLDSLKEEISEFEDQRRALVEKIRAKAKELLHSEKLLKEVLEELRFKEMSHAQESFSFNRYQADHTHGASEVKKIEIELFRLEKSAKEYATQILEISTSYKAALKHHQSILKERNQLERRYESCLEKQAQAKKVYREKQSDFQSSFQRWQTLDRAYHVEEVKVDEANARQNRLHQKLTQLNIKVAECENNISRCQAELKEKQQEVQNVETLLKQFEQVLQKFIKTRSEAQAKIEQARALKETTSHQLHTSQLVLDHVMTQKQELLMELNNQFALSIEEAQPLFDLHARLDVTVTKEQIKTLHYEIEKAGAVNLASIEECKEVESRFLTLDEQLKDVTKTQKDLELIITNLEKESRKVFKKTFEDIRIAFLKNFKILFNGGEANLTFTGGNDILEAGIDISAKPPGKQMRSIGLLSGGEKCLTALALLFALFEVKPAPFCILDEVDAPLDDSNIGRFTDLLKQFVSNTQFIIVTHNKKTMSVANVLFGVSMEEKGVSKLLSLAFEESNKEVGVVDPTQTEVELCKSGSQKK